VQEVPAKGIPSSPLSKPSQLAKSFSTDRLSLSSLTRSKNAAGEAAPPVPRLTTKDKQRIANADTAKKRDELWTAFRNLEGDYQKYV
jgi:hypothetical protein